MRNKLLQRGLSRYSAKFLKQSRTSAPDSAQPKD
jgi:hypothetical protein